MTIFKHHIRGPSPEIIEREIGRYEAMAKVNGVAFTRLDDGFEMNCSLAECERRDSLRRLKDIRDSSPVDVRHMFDAEIAGLAGACPS